MAWASAKENADPPATRPPAGFLESLRNPPKSLNTKRALTRISAYASDYANSGEPGPGGHAAWLQAVILAHALYNAEHGQGDYGWDDTAASDAMTALLPKALAPKNPAPTPSRHPGTAPAPPSGELMPEKLFPDHAFQHAAETGRHLMRLTMSPQALEHLRATIQRSNLVRHTAFDDTPSHRGAVPAHAATYRGIRIAVHREMTAQFLAEYTNGSLRYHKLDERFRIVNEPGHRF